MTPSKCGSGRPADSVLESAANSNRQRDMLTEAADNLRDGGRLVLPPSETFRAIALTLPHLIIEDLSMCLGVPGQVIEWTNRDPLFGRAIIAFDGIRQEVDMACVADAVIGDYVIVHAGLAICRIDTEEAEKTLDQLRQLADWPESQGRSS